MPWFDTPLDGGMLPGHPDEVFARRKKVAVAEVGQAPRSYGVSDNTIRKWLK